MLYKDFDEIKLHCPDHLIHAIDDLSYTYDCAYDTSERAYSYAVVLTYMDMGSQYDKESACDYTKNHFDYGAHILAKDLPREYDAREDAVILSSALHLIHQQDPDVHSEAIHSAHYLESHICYEHGIKKDFDKDVYFDFPEFLTGKDAFPEQYKEVIENSISHIKNDIFLEYNVTWNNSHLDNGWDYSYDISETPYVTIYALNENSLNKAYEILNSLTDKDFGIEREKDVDVSDKEIEIKPHMELEEKMFNVLSNVGESLKFYEGDDVNIHSCDNDRGELEIYGDNRFQELIHLASDPSKDDDLRAVALACAMSCHSHEDSSPEGIGGTIEYVSIDYEKVEQNLSAAREIIESDKIIEIEITHTFSNLDRNTSEDFVRSSSVNEPTPEQLQILNNVDKNIENYFPGVDSNEVTSSMLQEKINDDPVVISYNEELTHEIMTNDVNFANDHIIVLDHSYYDDFDADNNGPIHDMPNGDQYAVCIEITHTYHDNSIDINVSCDKDIYSDIAKLLNDMSVDRDEPSLAVKSFEINDGKNFFSLQLNDGEELEEIKDLVTDIVHEYSIEKNEHEQDKDILINR